jgi:O-antigen/teichoic acid export membrane protein
MGGSLRKSAQQAMLWSAGLNLFRDVLQFGQMLILVRLLDPAIYGMAGLATTFINFIGLISFQHIITHVLQVRGEGRVNYHQHFTAGVAINGGLFVLANLIAFALRFSEQYAPLQPLLHVLSFTFILSVPVDMRVKMLERDHEWSRLRLLQMGSILVSIAAAIAMALAGAGVYALIVPGLLASMVFVADLFLFTGWRPHWQWSYAEYREALHFGLNRAGSNALNGGRALLQNTLITQHFQFSALGVFGRAEGLANMFCGRIAQEASNALYPVITRAEAQTERFQRISGLVLQSVAWVVIPIAAFFTLEADNVVRLLYGQKWIEVIPLLSLVMAVTAIGSVGATAYRLLLANNRSRLCLYSDFAAFAIAIPTMLILLPFGLEEYLYGAIAVSLIVALVLMHMLMRTEGVTWLGLANAIYPPIVAVGVSCIPMWQINMVLAGEYPPLIKLLIAAPLFIAIYVMTLRILFTRLLRELTSYVPGGSMFSSLLRL